MTLGETTLYSTEILKSVYDEDYEALSVVTTPFYVTVINGTLTASNTGASTPLLVDRYKLKTIYVSTTTNCNVYVKGGMTADAMHFLMSSSDADDEDEDRLWNCNNERICFSVYEHLRYIQIVVDETGGADSTVRVDITGL